jgi:glucose-6-phosphate 1-epimerase
VPIAFPQFADEGPLKLHGFARESIWIVKEASEEEGIVMELKDNQTTREIWDFPFTLTYTVKLGEKGDELNLELKVVNEGEAEFTFGGCLHTYFGCEALSVNVSGLGGMDYIDKCDSRKVKKQVRTERELKCEPIL